MARFGRYELVHELGRGGMGSVYEARSEDGRSVALKRLHPQLEQDAAIVEAFEREARIASRIFHPAVCRVFDHGVESGSHFIAMELLSGQALDRLLKALCAQTAPPDIRHPWTVASIVARVARGLHAAHAATDEHGVPLSVVHRDVSPQNLYVLDDGGVKVIDFGIARSRLTTRRTTQGVVKGRIAYVSPEHLLSQPLDHRADVWAVGVVAWELLARRRLFRARSLGETVDALLRAEILPPSSVATGLPAELDWIVMKALSRDPDGRHASMAVLADALEDAIERHGGGVAQGEIAELAFRLRTS